MRDYAEIAKLTPEEAADALCDDISGDVPIDRVIALLEARDAAVEDVLDALMAALMEALNLAR